MRLGVAGAAASDCSIEGGLLPSSSDGSLPGGAVRLTVSELSWLAGSGVVLNFCSTTMCRLRTLLWLIGLARYIGHPQPPQSCWARVYCGCQPGPTRVALHPGRMLEKPEHQPYTHWTTFYDFEETRNVELCSCKKTKINWSSIGKNTSAFDKEKTIPRDFSATTQK